MTRPARSTLKMDPFLLMLATTVGLASLLPVRGAAATWAALMANVAIGLLFFLYGARLSRAAVVRGLANMRLHALVLGATYLLFPAIGFALAAGLAGTVDPALLQGILFLTLLPSTVQSSIAFTAIAGGDVAAAVCSASLSNLLGIFVTPLLVALLMHAAGAGGGSMLGSIEKIALQLLAPFLAGHLLRPVIGGIVDRHKRLLAPVDRGSILLIVYTAFSAAVAGGIWGRVDGADLALVLALCGLILALVMAANVLLGRWLNLPHEDAVVLLFCGSKKSLATGVPMAGALFPAAQVGLIILPLMIFHQLQLFVCTVVAARYGATVRSPPA